MISGIKVLEKINGSFLDQNRWIQEYDSSNSEMMMMSFFPLDALKVDISGVESKYLFIFLESLREAEGSIYQGSSRLFSAEIWPERVVI